jgi:hypothetical protein
VAIETMDVAEMTGITTEGAMEGRGAETMVITAETALLPISDRK